eukprot:7985124-Karenia_brevis.AAC.1
MSLSSWLCSNPLATISSRMHRSVSSLDVMLEQDFDEVDVPGDGRCFLYSVMVKSLLTKTEIDEWKKVPRWPSGIPKSPQRIDTERNMLLDWCACNIPPSTDSNDLDIQYILDQLNQTRDGHYQVQ